MAKKEVIALGKVSDDGIFKIYEPDYFKAKVSNTFKGKKIKITVQQDIPIASNPQMRYYFGVMIKLIREELAEQGTKYSVNDIDGFLRDNFLYEEVIDFVTGEVTTRAMRLNAKESKVTTVRMMKFWEEVQQWAITKLDCYIPDPNEEVKQEMLEQSPDNHK